METLSSSTRNISEQTLMERLRTDATDNTSLAGISSETNFLFR